MESFFDSFLHTKESSSGTDPCRDSSFTSTPPLDSQPYPISSRELHQVKTRSDQMNKDSLLVGRPQDMLGQLSFAPATQTTVVTTTTTTTTNFPPLVLKAPNHLYEMDSKLYPLAASPTPQALKRFCFDVGGRPALFCEADDTEDTLCRIRKQQQELKKSNGILRSTTNSVAKTSTGKARRSRGATPCHNRQSVLSSSSARSRRRASSPVSIAEAAKLAAAPCSAFTRRKISGTPERSMNDQDVSRQHNISRLQICQTSTPITPSLDTDTPDSGSDKQHIRFLQMSQGDSNQLAIPTPGLHSRGMSHILSPRPEDPRDDSSNTDDSHSTIGNSDMVMSVPTGGARLNDDTVAGSGPASLIQRSTGSSSRGTLQRPRPSVLDTMAAQDASLPSPSLSPVTAAANLQTRRGYFENSIRSEPVDHPALSSPPQENSGEDDLIDTAMSSTRYWDDMPSKPGFQSARSSASSDLSPRTFSMMEIPTMLDAFQAMPDEMRSYVMYQLLRRCPKPLLQLVAEVVNPALKCDFLNLLPLELCQTIIGHLDVKSLCRASQVSKKWRQVIDSDEKTWKNLFDAEGFTLPAGELQQAILHGWGWQHGSGAHDCERDLSDPDLMIDRESLITKLTEEDGIDSLLQESQVPCPQIKRPKRKAATKAKPASRKQQKRKDSSASGAPKFDSEALLRHVSRADGPYAAAQAAALAVPTSHIGLPTLRNLNLYKSIYRRHHLISSYWMQDEIKPRHLAFKAHQRHVVTCLQFDSDKILTGSDDTNINVYDTQTGQLRARLEGHEGGVWALQYEGNTLVSGSTDRSVRVWDIKRGECTHVFHGHTSTVRCLVILMPTVVGTTPDGRAIMMPKEPLIITGSRDSNLRIWKLPMKDDPPYGTNTNMPLNGGPLDDADCPFFVRALTGHGHSVRAIAAHADTLVSGSYDCTVRVWKVSTGETMHRLTGHAQKVYSVVLDHERNRCISGSMDNLVKIWSLDTGAVLFNLEGHSSLVGLLDLQRNRLVSAAADSTLRVWDPEIGQCKSILSAHTGAITCFQHDGQKVISGSDRTLKMWNIKTGEYIRDLLTDLSGVWQVKFDERRSVAAVQRNNLTYIEVLDFGAPRDGVPESKRGRRIVVDVNGNEINETVTDMAELDALVDD